MDPKLTKLELTSAGVTPVPGNAIVTAIIKVKDPDYVPPDVEVRARVDRFMFTGAFRAALLQRLEVDAGVLSIALPKRLRVLE